MLRSVARYAPVAALLSAVLFGLVSAAAVASAQVDRQVPDTQAAIQSSSPLAGSWEMIEIAVISARGESRYPDPAPGLFIFGGGYYSMVWMPLTEVPGDFAEIWRPTEEEKAAAFSSIIVNSGTYTWTDSTITTVPLVAKTPEFIGGSATYAYSISGDTLRIEMTDTVSRDGVRDPGVGAFSMPLTLVRVE